MIAPVSSTCFPCEEIPRYRKKAVKKVPKKADHKHEYESVILSYINPQSTFSPERGFIPGRDYAAGRRCRICGRLDYGFADSSNPRVETVIRIPWQNGTERKSKLIAEQYRHLPVVRIKDYWTLEKEEDRDGF